MMLKFHEADDIFALKVREIDNEMNCDVRAIIPGRIVREKDIIRLTAPSLGVDHRVQVLSIEGQRDDHGILDHIEGKFVE